MYIVSVMDEWVWNIAGIRLTGESRSTRKESGHIITSTTTRPGLNEGLRGEMPANNRLSHGRPFVCYSTSRSVKFEEALEGYFVLMKFHAIPIMVADF